MMKCKAQGKIMMIILMIMMMIRHAFKIAKAFLVTSKIERLLTLTVQYEAYHTLKSKAIQ